MFGSVSRASKTTAALLLTSLSLASVAHAAGAPNSCPAVFTRRAAPATSQAAQTQTSQSRAATAAARPTEAPRTQAPIGKPNGFNLQTFETAIDRYLHKGIKERPKTVEQKAALVAAALRRTEKRDIVNLEEWVRTASADEIKSLGRAIGKIDPRKGISPRRAENLFLDVLAITHSEKTTFRGLITQGFSAQKKNLILHWARTEFAQKPFIEALDSMWLVKDPGVRDVIRRRMAKHPNVVNTFNSIFYNSFFMTLFPAQFAGVPLPYALPKLDLLKRHSLSSSVKAQITRRGIDAAYDSLHARYGKLARFELAYSYARHVATGAMIAYAVTQLYPGFVGSLLPPGYINPDEDNAFVMGMKVIDYYTRLALLVRWDGITGKLLPTPEEKPKTDAGEPPAPQLPDALPPGADSQAATDSNLDAAAGDTAAAQGADYAPPAFDPAPDMPPDVPAAALPDVSPTSAPADTSAAAEPETNVLDF